MLIDLETGTTLVVVPKNDSLHFLLLQYKKVLPQIFAVSRTVCLFDQNDTTRAGHFIKLFANCLSELRTGHTAKRAVEREHTVSLLPHDHVSRNEGILADVSPECEYQYHHFGT